MRRLGRILLNAVALLSVVGCVAIAVDWPDSPGHFWIVFYTSGSDGGSAHFLGLYAFRTILHSRTAVNVSVPHGMAFAVLALFPLVRAGLWVSRRLRRVEGHCRACGYDLRATPGQCPECGAVRP